MMTMMTISLIIVTLIMGTDALKIQAPSNVVYTKQFSTVDETDFTVLDPKPQPPTRILAKWFPFGGLKAPKALDGELAADVGFDPIGKYTCTICYYVTYSFCDALKTIDRQASPRVRRPCTG